MKYKRIASIDYVGTKTKGLVPKINKFSKLVQKSVRRGMNKSGRWSTGNCARKWKVDHPTKWYVNKLVSVLENERYKIHSGFEKKASSSSSCHAASRDIPGPLSPFLPIVHRLSQVFRATSRFLAEQLYVCSSWPSCFCWAMCGVHRSTSLTSSSLLLQQCPTCLVWIVWIVFAMGGRWPYSWCFLGVDSRTCSILLAAFLRNCRLAFSPGVLLASK